MRSQGIGGSDTGAVVGMNRWKSPFQLWLEKTGQVEPEDISNKENVYWGTKLEPLIAQRFCEVTGKKLHRQGMMANVNYPWMLVNVDRLVVGENAGLECKTTNTFSAKEWDADNLPDSYYWQCQHYMMATGMSKWYIAVLIGGQDFRHKEIPRCQPDIDFLYEAEKEFWEVNVQQNIMPPVDGSDSCAAAIREKFKGGRPDPVVLPEESIQLLELIDNFKAEKKNLDANLKESENKLCLLLGDNEIGYAGERKVTWKVQNGRVTVDGKKLKAEQPDIYKQYTKVGKPTRVLRV
jgi:putative phage-type endonuclease